jgi:hypothetical protein
MGGYGKPATMLRSEIIRAPKKGITIARKMNAPVSFSLAKFIVGPTIHLIEIARSNTSASLPGKRIVKSAIDVCQRVNRWTGDIARIMAHQDRCGASRNAVSRTAPEIQMM